MPVQKSPERHHAFSKKNILKINSSEGKKKYRNFNENLTLISFLKEFLKKDCTHNFYVNMLNFN